MSAQGSPGIPGAGGPRGPSDQPLGGSIVLAAEDPAALAAFYGRLLASPPQVGLNDRHWRLPWPGGGVLEIYAPSRSRPQRRQRGRLALCLQRTAAAGWALALVEGWAAEACRHGAERAEAARQEAFGAEAWLLDPEGNGLLLLVIAAGSAPGAADPVPPAESSPDGPAGAALA